MADADQWLPRDWLLRYLCRQALVHFTYTVAGESVNLAGAIVTVTDGPLRLLSQPYLSPSLAMKEANWLLNQWQIKSGLKWPCVCLGGDIRVANLVRSEPPREVTAPLRLRRLDSAVGERDRR